ncbi:MAG TPA: DNA polymerase III subunit alpha, partial [Methanosarcinales archaeon]|nr:DNA polymerase III subunit alpha [Methanosarcinales archaeon]
MILGITEVDPIKYGLMFERFVNPLREQLADIDTDFGDPNVVKQYLIEKYGREHIASIANIIYLRPKVIVTDIVRSLEIGGNKSIAFGIAKKITDTVPDDIKTVEQAFDLSAEFRDYMLKYPEVYTYAMKLQNLPRQHGIHAAGVVISPKDRPLPDYLPLKMDKRGVVYTQYDKDRIEESGYLKVDILGVESLNTMDNAIDLIKEREKKGPRKQSDIVEGDKKAYDIICAGDTIGVFQLEASLAHLCKALKPRSISEISDINALGRPGCPPEEREDFIKRKNGVVRVVPLHPKLKDAMHRTYHKCVYEEDLISLGGSICGWDYGRADIMRRICKGKDKTRHLLPQLKEDFINDAYRNGVRKEDAEKLFEIVKYFSEYGFNRSHSVSYSIVAYRTAYLKAHFTTEFLTALINSEKPNSEDIKTYQTEIRSKGIKILPPDINKSHRKYSIEASKKIRMGLNSIKGVGDKAIDSIIDNRPYKTPMDFVKKVNHSTVNKNIVASLNDAGAFDGWRVPRKVLFDYYAGFKDKYKTAMTKERDKLLKEYANSIKEESPEITKDELKIAVKDMRKTIVVSSVEFEYQFPIEDEWPLKEKLEREFVVLGDYFSGSINDVYGDFFDAKFTYAKPLDGLSNVPDGHVVRFEGVIRKKLKEFKIKNKKSKNYGKMFGKYLIEDLHKNLSEFTVWPEQYRELKTDLNANTPIICTCKVSSFGGSKSLALKSVVKI